MSKSVRVIPACAGAKLEILSMQHQVSKRHFRDLTGELWFQGLSPSRLLRVARPPWGMRENSDEKFAAHSNPSHVRMILILYSSK